MTTANDLREAANLRYDGRFPLDVEIQIRDAEAAERRAADMAELMLLPVTERFEALARREWVSMRLIWRGRNGLISQRASYRHTRNEAYFTHIWRQCRADTVPHLIAWAAFRDAHRKIVAATAQKAAA